MRALTWLTRGAGVLAAAVTLTAAAALLPVSNNDPGSSAVALDQPLVPSGDLAQQITSMQARLQQQPRDAVTAANLGLLAVEQARITGDSGWYAIADRAVQASMVAQPDANATAWAARAALRGAQHRFSDALHAANRALRINPLQQSALAIRVDALTELGRWRQGKAAAVRLDQVQPGLVATTRLAYQYDLRGKRAQAVRLFSLVAEGTGPPRAFVEQHLADLAARSGDAAGVRRHVQRALRANPGNVAVLALRARWLAAQGRIADAVAVLKDVTTRSPLPEYATSLGELYLVMGRPDLAAAQFDVVRAIAAIAEANGSQVDLELSQLDADHGSARSALRGARAEWQRRKAPVVADAMAWALHANGRDRQALHFARIAVRDQSSARALHHLGAIQASLGRDAAARESLRGALAVDRSYDPWRTKQVRRLLRELGGR